MQRREFLKAVGASLFLPATLAAKPVTPIIAPLLKDAIFGPESVEYLERLINAGIKGLTLDSCVITLDRPIRITERHACVKVSHCLIRVHDNLMDLADDALEVTGTHSQPQGIMEFYYNKVVVDGDQHEFSHPFSLLL